MLKFLFGMIVGGVIVLILYACILVGKENEKINEAMMKEKDNQDE